jgi:peptide/nickel transport system permease protein
MANFILKRFLVMLLTLFLVSIIVFIVIKLPPGDYAERYAFKLSASGVNVSQAELSNLKHQFGLDQPGYVQYFVWIKNILTEGNFGLSFQYQKPVTEVIGERILYTAILAFVTLLITYGMAIPIGIISAIKQYSPIDYLTTFIGYIGLGIPTFMLALVLLYLNVMVFGMNVGGLFSPEYVNAPWSILKAVDLLKHIWIPALVLGASGTAFQIRTIRATMLDEKNNLYVTVARAKGLPELRTLMKYPVRVALNPTISTIGWELAAIVSGAPIVALVLGLPDTGPLFLSSLLDQDMYLAGTMLLMMSMLTIIGTLISDILLAILDPRVRMGVNA